MERPQDGEGPGMDGSPMEEQMRALQAAQQAYLEQSFRWLIDYVTSYFPGDQLAMEDVVTDVHFLHTVVEGGQPLGTLVYRFRKMQDKKAYFEDLREEYREGLGVPEVLFVDSETARFEPTAVGEEGSYWEIPPEKLTAKMKELREELKRRSRLRGLRESL